MQQIYARICNMARKKKKPTLHQSPGIKDSYDELAEITGFQLSLE
jgi:hypothetical protein